MHTYSIWIYTYVLYICGLFFVYPVHLGTPTKATFVSKSPRPLRVKALRREKGSHKDLPQQGGHKNHEDLGRDPVIPET